MWNLSFLVLGLLVALSTQQENCNTRTYEGYGTYDNCEPWDCCPLPQSPEQIGTQFRLYTRANSGIFDWQEISPGNPGAFAASRSTIFLVHGFSQSGFAEWVTDMMSALLLQGDYNVIVVDWSSGASVGFRSFPASNTQVVGSIIAELSQDFADNNGLNLADVQCIGFSLGGHACGFFGKNMTGTVGRITGLDPAGDAFNHDFEDDRLSAGDAAFVDIIHTNAFGWIPSGINRDCGDVDFWANGGRDQPGCLFLGEICDHQRAPVYYRATVEGRCTYLPTPCNDPIVGTSSIDNCPAGGASDAQQVGISSANFPGRGTYWFRVSRNYPHCGFEN